VETSLDFLGFESRQLSGGYDGQHRLCQYVDQTPPAIIAWSYFSYRQLLACIPINIDSTSVSSFDYAYSGQALIVAFTPVMILSYLLSGLLRPVSLVSH
jgi:hypothetical protein